MCWAGLYIQERRGGGAGWLQYPHKYVLYIRTYDSAGIPRRYGGRLFARCKGRLARHIADNSPDAESAVRVLGILAFLLLFINRMRPTQTV